MHGHCWERGGRQEQITFVMSLEMTSLKEQLHESMPLTDVVEEREAVLPFVQNGGPAWDRTTDLSLIRTVL